MENIEVPVKYGDKVTKFWDLPDEVQLKIFSKLRKNSDVLSARLVCSKWLILINHILKPLGLISNEEELELIKKSYFNSIRALFIKKLNSPLPIYSSTRSGLPYSKALVLLDGISAENMLKLLRYYTGYVNELHLLGCFENMLKHICSGFNVDNIYVLQFHTKIETDQSSIELSSRTSNHILALSKFIQLTCFKNLRKLTGYFIYAEDPEGIVTNHEQLLSDEMNHAFKEFLIKHGSQLVQLNVFLFGHVNSPILEQFSYVNKDLESLEVWYGQEEPLSAQGFLLEFIKCLALFEKLKQFSIFLDPCTWIEITDSPFAPLINIYKSSLESLTIFHPMGGIDWIHSTKISHLHSLQLLLIGEDIINFSDAMSRNYKIETLADMNKT